MAARAEHDAGRISWSDVAADTGCADQPHMTRDTRVLTGVLPGALANLVEHDESYWFIRHLAVRLTAFLGIRTVMLTRVATSCSWLSPIIGATQGQLRVDSACRARP